MDQQTLESTIDQIRWDIELQSHCFFGVLFICHSLIHVLKQLNHMYTTTAALKINAII